MVEQRKKLAFSSADTDAMKREIAAPTLAGIRSVLSTHPASGMTPERLARILRDVEAGQTEAYFDLAEHLEENYLHYQGVLGARKRAVAQLPITVNAAGDDERAIKDADLLRKLFKRPAVKRALMDMLDAIGKGYSVQEAVWSFGKEWLPERLINRSQKWFEPDQVDPEVLRLKGGPEGTSGLPTDLPPYKFVIHRHRAKTGLSIRGGLARGVAWAWLFQNFALKDWVILAEIYGIPMRLGKYDANATDDERRTLMRAVVGIGTDAAGIIPRSMEVEFVNAMANGNAELFKELCIYLDDQVSKAVLGQTGTSDAKASGLGSGSATVHNEVREDIMRADAEALADTLTELGQWVIDLNHGPPPSGEYPEIEIGAEEFFTKEDMDKIAAFVEMGGEVEMSVVRDKLGLPEPAEKTADGQPPKLLKPRSGGAQVAANDPAQDASQNSGPQGGGQGAGAIGGPKNPQGGSQPPLKPLKNDLSASDAVAAAALSEATPTQAYGADDIDDLMDELEGLWEPVSAPVTGPIGEAIAAATSIDDLQARMLKLADNDPARMTELMARAMFMGRLSGEVPDDQ